MVEMTPAFSGADRDLSDVLYKRVKNLFAKIMLETKVVKMETAKTVSLLPLPIKKAKNLKKNTIKSWSLSDAVPIRKISAWKIPRSKSIPAALLKLMISVKHRSQYFCHRGHCRRPYAGP